MININMFFDFVIILFENHMFKISLIRIFKMLAKCQTLQGRLCEDEY
jgi:hypothetical protein